MVSGGKISASGLGGVASLEQVAVAACPDTNTFACALRLPRPAFDVELVEVYRAHAESCRRRARRRPACR